jgi:PAS domain S-box-containing protein
LSDLLGLTEEQRLRLLVSAITDYAIYMLDPDGYVRTWNPGALRFKGYSADEIIGQHFSRFFLPEDADAGVPERALEAAFKEGRFEAEGWRLRKDGTRFWVNAVIDPIYDDDGKHIGFAKVTRDFTEKKLAEDELKTTQEQLAQSQKLQALGELTGGVAHDFNNLMTVIAGASDFLLKHPDLPPEKQRRYLEAIAETTERATSLTNHLLAFGRRQALKPVVLDLNVRLDAFAEMAGRMLGSPINVELELQASHPLVEVDATQLETALLNAALNARDAMDGRGKLIFGTSDCKLDEEPAVCIVIRDSGPGIADEVLKRVFEPFFTTKEVGKGTGLGLSQIHGFAAQAGGRAEIESVEGQGATLRIYLPRTGKPLREPEEAGEGGALPHGLKVLLVEDNSQVRDFAAELLADLHCEVTKAEDGREALELLRSQPFDLVFSDVVMPGMGGVELARKIAAERPGMPVLLATGYSAELLGQTEQQFTVVTKPYDATILGTAITNMMQNARESMAE